MSGGEGGGKAWQRCRACYGAANYLCVRGLARDAQHGVEVHHLLHDRG
jgi:membrane-bound lytic murein transglycosylase B